MLKKCHRSKRKSLQNQAEQTHAYHGHVVASFVVHGHRLLEHHCGQSTGAVGPGGLSDFAAVSTADAPHVDGDPMEREAQHSCHHFLGVLAELREREK